MLEACLDEPLWHEGTVRKGFFFFFLVENTLENQDELIYNDELKLQK